jgi:K+-transporting ATPase ATPase C chain
LVVTGLAQVLFHHQANGSLIKDKDGKVVGSELIGQPFSDPRHFWSRLSATSDSSSNSLPYNAGNSSGSNLGPLNPALSDNVKARVADLKAADPASQPDVPVDLVTASGSGLDPDISVAAAEYQIPRVAKARKMDQGRLRDLVAKHTQPRQLGILGEPRVNVLELNLALDQLAR